MCPRKTLWLLAEPKALGVCPCRIYCFWQSGSHWVCGNGEEFKALGVCPHKRTEGIGSVPVHNILLLAQLKALGLCPCRRTEGTGHVLGLVSHFCRVVCNAIGRSESGVCIAFVLGIIVTTPDVHVSGMVPVLRKRFSDSCICGSKTFCAPSPT